MGRVCGVIRGCACGIGWTERGCPRGVGHCPLGSGRLRGAPGQVRGPQGHVAVIAGSAGRGGLAAGVAGARRSPARLRGGEALGCRKRQWDCACPVGHRGLSVGCGGVVPGRSPPGSAVTGGPGDMERCLSDVEWGGPEALWELKVAGLPECRSGTGECRGGTEVMERHGEVEPSEGWEDRGTSGHISGPISGGHLGSSLMPKDRRGWDHYMGLVSPFSAEHSRLEGTSWRRLSHTLPRRIWNPSSNGCSTKSLGRAFQQMTSL